VHAAKGLEFSVVFVAGLEEGLFPHEGMSDEDRDEEEERRLFYVAITRAKSDLYLTLARVRRIYGTDYLQEPSSFLSDIDASLVKYAHGEEESIIEA
jgi:DNA helicase II / ATP-dependent DNA helicase PcrA